MTDETPETESPFDSDVERRVLGHVAPSREDLDTLTAALELDDYSPLMSADEVNEILLDLEAKGYLSKTKGDKLKTTAAGKKALAS